MHNMGIARRNTCNIKADFPHGVQQLLQQAHAEISAFDLKAATNNRQTDRRTAYKLCDVTDTAAQLNFQIIDNDTLTFLYLDKSAVLGVVIIVIMIIIIIIPNKLHENIRGGEIELHSQPCNRRM
jgi:hypothetical protein